MDSDELASMYAQIVNGVPKDKSRFVTDDESSRLWDQIAEEVEQIKADNPDAQFSVPNELPAMDDDADPAWTGVARGGPPTAGDGEGEPPLDEGTEGGEGAPAGAGRDTEGTDEGE